MAAIPVVTRIHEWLADHVSWIQYPEVTLLPERRYWRWRYLSGKQKAWTVCGAFWLCIILLSIIGNFL